MHPFARFASLTSVAALVFAGCSSSTDAGPNANPDGGAQGDTGTVDGDAPASSGLAFKTYVILGDSISDGGGQGPFFHDLLQHNDDAKYPAYAGKDLTTKYGNGLKVVKASKGGARAVNLDAQVGGLPTSLDGPVLVTITIGGNDVTAALATILTGGSDAKDRDAFQGYLGTALDELTKPGRFGAGVAVRVVLTNIYDPSDGTGNFVYDGKSCPGGLGFWPKGKATTPLLDPWEAVMATEAGKHPEVSLVDLRAKFDGHGVETGLSSTWFYSDCIHPDALGHDAVRALVWDAVSKY